MESLHRNRKKSQEKNRLLNAEITLTICGARTLRVGSLSESPKYF